MKIELVGFLLVILLCSCKSKRAEVASCMDGKVPDTVSSLPGGMFIEDEARPLEADELFDDFIFNYALDETLQIQRTRFPLPCQYADTLINILEKDWKHDYLFAKQNYYTLFFDNESDMELAGDTTLCDVQVEWISLVEPVKKKFYFVRDRGMWMLEKIDVSTEKRAEDDFLSFYARFVTDSVFQRNHIYEPLIFVTLDPDDEFSVLETTLDVDQWYVFRPQLPVDGLSNICYGQRNEKNSISKILKINGIGNGYSNVFYFNRRDGQWKLYKYEDTSI